MHMCSSHMHTNMIITSAAAPMNPLLPSCLLFALVWGLLLCSLITRCNAQACQWTLLAEFWLVCVRTPVIIIRVHESLLPNILRLAPKCPALNCRLLFCALYRQIIISQFHYLPPSLPLSLPPPSLPPSLSPSLPPSLPPYLHRTMSNPNVPSMKKIADLYAEVIGVLSQARFVSVRKRFFAEIRDPGHSFIHHHQHHRGHELCPGQDVSRGGAGAVVCLPAGEGRGSDIVWCCVV